VLTDVRGNRFQGNSETVIESVLATTHSSLAWSRGELVLRGELSLGPVYTRRILHQWEHCLQLISVVNIECAAKLSPYIGSSTLYSCVNADGLSAYFCQVD
jgi:hypothetical protein